MPGPFDLTGQNIEDTYQRILQTDGTSIYNGTGSLFTLPSTFPFTGSALITGSLGVTGSTSIQGTFNQGSASLASGLFSHVQGLTTTASGIYSHAEGDNTKASGSYSHAEGLGTIASGSWSHAEGRGAISIGASSHAEGRDTISIGNYSHAEGTSTQTIGDYSHAEGNSTQASGSYSHAEGNSTQASGSYSHAEGDSTKAIGIASHAEGGGAQAIGVSSHAEGFKTIASGSNSHAEGVSTQTTGSYSHAEGDTTKAIGIASHAEGQNTIASGNYSHTEGDSTQATGKNSHAEGASTQAIGDGSHAEGNGTYTIGAGSHAEGVATQAIGEGSHAEGINTIANGEGSHAEGGNTQAIGDNSHAEGNGASTGITTAYSSSVSSGIVTLDSTYGDISAGFTTNDRLLLYDTPFDGTYGTITFIINQSYYTAPNTILELVDTSVTTTTAYVGNLNNQIGKWNGDQTIPGSYSHAEGTLTYAIGVYSHAEGNTDTIAIGGASHAEGLATQAIGAGSHAEGNGTYTIGAGSHAEGVATQAIGEGSHAEGSVTTATGDYSHAEGDNTQAIGNYSHAEGQETITLGQYSHAEGYNTITSASYQHVQGQWNVASSVQSAFIVGNGTDNSNRSNLIYAAGNEVQISGSLSVSGSITGSLFGTASWATNALTASYLNTLNQNLTFNGNLTLNGTASIGTLVVNQTVLSTGSNQLGDSANDTQTLYGSVIVPTGSLTVSGNVSFGTSSAGFYWDNTNGYLGIKKTTPAVEIDVVGSIRATSTVFNSTTQTQNIQINSGVSALRFLSGSVETARYDGNNWGFYTTAPTARLHIKGSGATSATTALRVENTNASASLVVLDDGNVGIGTTSSVAPLQVGPSTGQYLRINPTVDTALDTGFSTSRVLLSTNATTTFGASYSPTNGNGGIRLGSVGSYSYIVGGTNLLLNPVGGNVGIGLITPSASLHISGASSAALLEIDSPTVNNILYVSGSGNVGIATNTSAYRLQINASGSSDSSLPLALTSVDANNRVGILFASSSVSSGKQHRLWHRVNTPTVEWLLGTIAGENATWRFQPRDDSNYAMNFLTPYNGGTAYITTGLSQSLFSLGAGSQAAQHINISSSGNVGIGTITPAYKLDVSGSARFKFTPSGADLFTIDGATTTRYFIVENSNGFVGIGNGYTTSATPLTSVDIRGNTSIKGGSATVGNAFTITNSTPITLFTVQNNGLVGIGKTPTSSLDVAGTTRLSGSFNTAASGSILTVIGSGSTQPIFTVQGSQGELFSITDSLSGSLFSVNDISGLPILEVFSDNTTLIGDYQDPMLITTKKVTMTNSGSFVVYSLPTASYDTAFFDYSIKSGSNARAGQIMAIQSGSSVNFTETTTTDFGNTTAVSFTVIVSGSNMVLTGSASTGSWTIKSIIRGI